MEAEAKPFVDTLNDLVSKALLKTHPNLIFICSNKTTGSKFYSGDSLKVP